MSKQKYVGRLAGLLSNSTVLLGVGVGVGFSVLFYLNAYVNDDAFFFLRVVDNFVQGYGLRWNPLERVQVFTAPLYTLVLIPFYWLAYDPLWLPNPTRAYFTAMFVGYAASLAAVLFVTLSPPERRVGIVGFALLASSQAFVTFASSGMETPLTYLLVALFYVGYLRGLDPFWLLLCAALGVVNRLDTALLLLAPSCHLIVVLLRQGRWQPILIAALPLFVWFSFALVYYGSLLPTPYYAKVTLAADPGVLARMGAAYVLFHAYVDPVTVVLLASAPLLALLGVREALAALSALAYVAYVVKVGGDFMGPRFLAPPFLICVLLAQRSLASRPPMAAACFVAGLVLYSCVVPSTPVRAYRDPPAARNVRYYFSGSALRHWRPGLDFPFRRFGNFEGIADCRKLRSREPKFVLKSPGLRSFCHGPTAYCVTTAGIANPLLARIDLEIDRPYLPGHLTRPIPEGYAESVMTGTNRIHDPRLAAYYDKILLLTRGPIFDRARWGAIWKLNFTSERRYPGGPLRSPRTDDPPGMAMTEQLSALLRYGVVPWH